MKKITVWIIAFSLALGLLAGAAGAIGAGTPVYNNTQQIADNLSYTKTISSSASGLQEGYALNLSGSGDAYPIVMACDTIYGSLAVDNMIAYAEGQGKNVLAAVNTDFFSTKTGVPLGLVVENGVYKSSPEEHTAVAFMPDGGVYFSASPQVTVTLSNNGGAADASNSGKTVALTHFNKYRVDSGGLYLFSSAFSTVSTRTVSNGWFVRLKILSGAPSVSGTMSLEVTETTTADGAVPIGDGYLVLTAATAGNLGDEFNKFKVGDRVTLTTACSDPNLTNAKWATGGGDILIKDGAMTDQLGWDSAITAKNPRTAFGVKADGTVISYVADGRETYNASGLTLKSLAEELLNKGCVNAVNFDGGGSSVMSVRIPGRQDCIVVNSPSDGSPRKVAAYLLFVTDKSPDGRPKNLALYNDGPVVLSGSSVNLSYAASDGGYMPVTAPSDVTAVSGGLGTVSGTVYKAGNLHGVDKLTLKSASTGASGFATIHIINDPTDLTVTAGGSTAPVTALTVWPGDTVQLKAAATYNGLPVSADDAAFKYAVTGGVGTVTAGGLFTAGASAGIAGTITLTVGGKTVSIPVTVAGFSDTATHWAKPYIRDLSEKAIVSGVTATTFAPEANIKRGDFVLMLYRAAGKPAVTGSATFTDVQPSDYYADAIAWAEASGIAQGSGGGLFNPSGTLTREQAFTFVYRALTALKITVADGTQDALAAFTDKGKLSDYAVTPTATLVKLGIVSGSNGKLTPKSAMTRAQMAKILSSVLELA